MLHFVLTKWSILNRRASGIRKARIRQTTQEALKHLLANATVEYITGVHGTILGEFYDKRPKL